MRSEVRHILDTLQRTHRLTVEEYAVLLQAPDAETLRYAAGLAADLRRSVYGRAVYLRALIECTNHCRNNCFYCGIRRDNTALARYRLDAEAIHACCARAYAFGIRTFVLQGGEDPYYTDQRLCAIVAHIRKTYPDCAITLSLGERPRHSYQALYDAGADRYLLRHESADREHYGQLHPPELSWERRLQCLEDLKEIGYQTGCGFMVGSPHQSVHTLARDLYYIQEFSPAMCGIGPFLPHSATPFRDRPGGDVHTTLYLLSLARLIKPTLLLPATTALGTLHPRGYELGLLAGANVLMPNFSPAGVRGQYALYDNKLCAEVDSAAAWDTLARRVEAIGYGFVVDRGDAREDRNSDQGACPEEARPAADRTGQHPSARAERFCCPKGNPGRSL